MTTSLSSLPHVLLREIFEYTIDSYTTENRERYTLLCKQLYLIFKIIIKNQVDKFKGNPVLLRLYQAELFSNITDNYALAAYIKFNYDYSDQRTALQAIEFLKTCLFSEFGGLKFGYYSLGHGLLRKIVKSGPKKFQNVTGLEYEQTIGPIVIEFFAQRGDESAAELAGMFFEKSTWIFQFMIKDVLDWMNTRKIPESPLERERLTKAIKIVRNQVILFVYNGAAHAFLSTFLSALSVTSNNHILKSYSPLLFCSFFMALFVLTAFSQNTAVPVNTNPLTKSELEAKAEEIDYFSDILT